VGDEERGRPGGRPTRSWVLGEQPALASALAVAAAGLFAVAAVGLFVTAGWWRTVTVAAAGVSLALTALFPAAFKPAVWILAPVAINAGLIVGVVGFSWPSLVALGG
jgi:hypothetical protein